MYVHGSEERLIQAARGDKIDHLEAASVLKRSKKEKRLEDWEKNVLYGQYLWQTKKVRSDQCWAWLQNGDLKRETESLKVAAQNQSTRTNLVKAKIDKSQGDSLCRMCRKVDESIDHIVSGCGKLAQKEYKRRHDKLGKIVHWKLARKCNIEAGNKWYEHEPESVLENEDYKILWDFSISTDDVGEAQRLIMLQKIWNVKVKIIPLVVGSLGAIPKQVGNGLKQIGITAGTAQDQKSVLLGTARILRKVLEI